MKYCFSFLLLAFSLLRFIRGFPVALLAALTDPSKTSPFRVGSESVVIDSFLGFSQGVRVGFISSPEDGIELILMRRKIVSLSAGRLSDQGILGNPASVFHPLK
jgi:hypothetical protein